ncbi:MAG: glycosyl hydrolase, partial [Planctomycetota bacterium]
TLAELVAENYYGRFRELCESRGIKLLAEAAGAQAGAVNPVQNSRRVDVPMSEFWLIQRRGEDLLYMLKRGQLESVAAAELYGGQIIAAEAFTTNRGDWTHDPALLKPIADAAFTVGMNQLYHHASVHQPDERVPGWSMVPNGINVNRKLTWSRDMAAWSRYLARCQALLQLGEPVVDVLALMPEDVPTFHEMPRKNRLLDTLPYPGYRMTVLDAETLERLKVEGGHLVAPSGLRVPVLDSSPAGPKSDEVKTILEQLRRKGAYVGGRAERLLDRAGVEPDVIADGPPLAHIHRVVGSDHLYFLATQADEPATYHVSLRATAPFVELWHPVTGRIESVEVPDGNRTRLTLDLAQHGSVFVVLRQQPTHGATPRDQAAEAIDVAGPWTLTFPSVGSTELDTLLSWTDLEQEKQKFFSGTATYETAFVGWPAGERVVLELGQLHNIARVTVNGTDLGVAWTPPYRVDVSDALVDGENTLRIEVTNLWPNRMIGNTRDAAGGPDTWTNNHRMWNADSDLLKSGLLGPVRLIGIKSAPDRIHPN